MINLTAKKSLGQNFLQDPSVHQRIVKNLAPKPEDTFIEIGPGTGLLTKHLLSSPMKKLIAFELDDRAVPLLKEEFSEQGDRFQIEQEDILKVDLDAVSEKESTKLRVVGNIPYYITSPILFKLIDERDVVRDATLLVQLEVAERLTADPRTKEYGIPTVLANFFGEVKFLFKVPAGAFKPKPNVDSAVIHLDLENGYFERNKITRPDGFSNETFRKLVRGAFAMRRKTLRNNLKGAGFGDKLPLLESTHVGAIILGRRAEELTIEEYLALYAMLEL
jgi:16S rRNA (adenine1518-N6/adenine1519-N6)-dimethyltransferase